MELNFTKKLVQVQKELKAPKGQFNSFGKYSYRSCEDIIESVKPILSKYDLCLHLSDEIVFLGDRYYIKANATITDGENSVSTTAYAREPLEVKGMSESQITGTASSYARKYALNGLLAIDDTKDADTDEYRNQTTHQPKSSNDYSLDKVLLDECKQLEINLNNVATYLKKDVMDLTNEDLKICIERKKKAMGK